MQITKPTWPNGAEGTCAHCKTEFRVSDPEKDVQKVEGTGSNAIAHVNCPNCKRPMLLSPDGKNPPEPKPQKPGLTLFGTGGRAALAGMMGRPGTMPNGSKGQIPW